MTPWKLKKATIAIFLMSAPGVTAQAAPSHLAPVNVIVPGNDTKDVISVAPALKISAGDLIDVTVIDTPELSAKLRVNEKGAITLPVGGDVAIQGLTAEEASHAIEAQLLKADVLKHPNVNVTVDEYATQGVTVMGEVKNPGVYPILGARRLPDLISDAGGVTASAGKAVTITHRETPDKSHVVMMDAKPGDISAYNVEIQPGDTIVVSHAGIVYVVGDVVKPGGFLLTGNDHLTVLQAIALAQGTNRTASLKKARLIRKTETGREELPIQLNKILANNAPDEPLADGDILFVPSSTSKNVLRDMESILPSAAGAAIIAAP